ncbi:uncharacterized protein LOC134217411 [Armigeres subalbatus]|uniref:uncharacterized protein LOC134217411 n=1 Tax=Armigeres subalbatus TaxID=124917 RepID=UPI002ED188CB
MMIRCFQHNCQQDFNTIDEYVAHLKGHNLKDTREYKCTYRNCPQSLSSFYKLRRHLECHSNDGIQQMNDCPSSSKMLKSDEHEVGSVLDLEKDKSADETACPSTSNADKLQSSLSDLDHLAINFVIDLHRKRNFNRKDVTDILGGIRSVYSNLGDLIASSAPASQDGQQQYTFDTYVKKVSNIFEFVDTEYKLLKYLEETDLYKSPDVYVVNIDKVELCKEVSEKKTHLVMTNLKFQIRKFFEVDNILSDTLKNMENLKQNSNLQNFVNGALYRSVEEKYAGKIVMPVFFI